MNAKSLLKSRTFWLNLLGLIVSIAGVAPPKYAMPALTIANIGLRLLTTQPVNVLPFK